MPPLRPADSRSKFLEGFHNLLHMCSVFYKEDNDTTVIADAFPLLNALREVHLLLAQGAHNQFGDLPWTARVEMLMQQWLLARPEMRDFLQSRPMVPYTEAWMPQVDTMKTLQGWSDVTVTHFHDLASSASRYCCRSATATGSISTTRAMPRTGRATGGRRSRATSTPIAP